MLAAAAAASLLPQYTHTTHFYVTYIYIYIYVLILLLLLLLPKLPHLQQ